MRFEGEMEGAEEPTHQRFGGRALQAGNSQCKGPERRDAWRAQGTPKRPVWLAREGRGAGDGDEVAEVGGHGVTGKP